MSDEDDWVPPPPPVYCIGGPADGQWREDVGLELRVHPREPLPTPEAFLSAYTPPRPETYRKLQIARLSFRKAVYVHEGTSDDEALAIADKRRLI